MRLLSKCVAVLCAFIATTAAARPFTTDDLLRLEDVGQVQFAPGGRWLVIQSFAGQDTAGRYDYDHQYRRVLSRLSIVDLTRPGPAEPLLPPQAGVGYTPGPISPSGRWMLVSRLDRHLWEAGLVDLATRQVRWLGLSIDLPIWGRSAAWRSDDQLVAIATPADSPPLYLRVGSQAQSTLPGRWARTADGLESASMIGSGRYLSRGGAAPSNSLVLINAANGHLTTLAKGEYFDLEPSSDGRFVAAVRWGADIQPQPGDVVRGATATRRRDLDLVDLRQRTLTTPCAGCDVTSHLLSWSPQTNQLLVYARQPGQTWPQGHLTIIDATAGHAIPLQNLRPAITHSLEGVEIVRAGWLGGSAIAWTTEGDQPGWRRAGGEHGRTATELPVAASQILLEGDALLALSDGMLWRSSLGARRPHAIGAFAPLVPSGFGEGARVATRPVWTGGALTERQGGRVLRITARAHKTDLGPIGREEVVLATASQAMVIARTDEHGILRLVLRRAGAERPLMTLNRLLGDVDFGPVRSIRHSGPEGQDLTSWVVLPPGWDAQHPPPVVVLPYPGAVYDAAAPSVAKPGAVSYATNAQLLAAHGYAALIPSLPRNAAINAPAHALGRDILAIVDAAGAQGLVDPDHVALWGQSFGGFAALAAASQSSRFFAVVDTAGPTDLSFSQGRILPQGRWRPEDGLTLLAAIGWAETGQAGLGGPPWATPERYWQNSPRLQADKITAPVFLAYGDLDPVGLDEGEAMFSALYRQGKDARLLTFWGEGHVILSPGNVRRLYREALIWLDAALAEHGEHPALRNGAP